MTTVKVIHKLMNEFCDTDFRQISMCLITYKTHGEDVRECVDNQVWLLISKQLETLLKIFELLGCVDLVKVTR